MEKDRKEPVYTEHGYVYDYEDDSLRDDRNGENPDGIAAAEEIVFEEKREPDSGEKISETGRGTKGSLRPALITVVLLLGILAGAFLLGQVKRAGKIVLNRYFSVSAAGFDGYGRAEVSMDREALESDIAAVLLSEGAIGAGEGQSRLDAFRNSEHYKDIMEAVSWNLDREEDLSNGDVITLTMSYEPEDPDGYGLVCRTESVLYTVSGLSEVVSLDPFEDLIVTVSGTGPEGMLHLEWDESLPWTYTASSDRGLSNGDEILISVSAVDGMDEKALAGGWGYDLTRMDMTYKVEGLPFHAVSLSNLSDEAYGGILDLAAEKARQHVTEGYAPDESLTDLVPAGTLLLCRKENEEGFFNKIFFLFRVSYSNRETSLDYYYYVSCQDLVLYPDGTWTLDTENCEFPVSLHGLFGLIDSGDYIRIDRLHAVTGFASPEDFYAACIEPMENTCTVSGGLD